MHHRVMGPPAVSCAVHRTARLGLVLLALWLSGVALATAAWASSGVQLSAVHFMWLFAALALPTLGVAAFWRTQRERVLQWDGRHWTLGDLGAKPAPIGLRRVEVRLDLQGFLLLRCLGPGAWSSTWVWAERGRQAERWHLLRCALYHTLPAESDDSLMEGGLGAAQSS